MLKLKNICKYYKIGKNKQVILDNINISFNNTGLNIILGASGSGKSTLLNIIAGNLKEDSGDVWFDRICISKLKDKSLDAYRTNIVGNVFQDYNLIDYMNVWDNVMVNYNGVVSKDYIIELLKQLLIYDKRKVLVSKLSGGERQRVAIARALVNNPRIILCDEPTGALDTENSITVMEILKKISKSRLVIVVSHDNYLANKYADRIINISDGKCISYNVFDESHSEIKLGKVKKRSLIKIAFKNLKNKLFRTFITSFSIALGFISMYMVVSLYYNFNSQIRQMEEDIVSVFPITISNTLYQVESDDIDESLGELKIKNKKVFTNKITYSYLNYLDSIDKIKYLTYDYDISMPIISDSYNLIDNNYFNMMPSYEFINSNYDILYGNIPSSIYEIVLIVDSDNAIDKKLLDCFNIYDNVNYADIVGRHIKIIENDDYYIERDGYFISSDNYYEMYNNSTISLEIVGIVKGNVETLIDGGFYYDKGLVGYILDKNIDSEIVKYQSNHDYNVLGLNIKKEDMLNYLGYNSLPSKIDIYVDNILDKEAVIKKLEQYNTNNKVIFTDTMKNVIDIVKEFILIISGILLLFSIISLVISLLMVGTLTNVRVLEQRREIGILRSLGVSKKRIKGLFNMQNIFISVLASIIGILIIFLIKEPLNILINKYIELDNIFSINYVILTLIILANMLVVKMAGAIPANLASRMEIVKCIYNK